MSDILFSLKINKIQGKVNKKSELKSNRCVTGVKNGVSFFPKEAITIILTNLNANSYLSPIRDDF